MQPDRPPSCYQPVMDEPALLATLATDLDAGFEALVRDQADRIYSIALRLLGRPADAEDATQDTFVRAYQALGDWAPDRIRQLRLGPWLATIAVNVVRTRARRRATRPVERLEFLDELGHPATGPSDRPDDRLVLHEARDAWAARLLGLPERYRAPIVLRHVDGLAYDEIALALDRPEGTVKAQVHRGLALLRATLEAEDRAEADGRSFPDAHPGSTDPGRVPRPTATPDPRLQEVPR